MRKRDSHSADRLRERDGMRAEPPDPGRVNSGRPREIARRDWTNAQGGDIVVASNVEESSFS
jgi:hypothetical protein